MAPSAIATFPYTPQQEYNTSYQAESFNGIKKAFAKKLIGNALQERIDSIDQDNCEPGGEDAFFVADLGEIYRQHMRWKRNLPRVEPFYAVKCNPNKTVLKLLAALGTGFDCASKTEIQTILDLGVTPSRIIYAHPCKTASYIRYSSSVDVQMMTFDNAEELVKIHKFYPQAKLLLRILTDDSKSLCRLSLKYGAPLDTTRSLLELASKLGLDVIGVSFHVGSGSYDPTAFVRSVIDARKVFDEAAEFGYDMKTLDVGGGYGHDNFESVASLLGPALDKYFPPSVRVIAEPGRYYVASAFTIATHVIARRTVKNDNGISSFMLYLNDGVYGNFSGKLFDHQNPVAKVLKHKDEYFYEVPQTDSRLIKYSVWGPTCDSLDCIDRECYLPELLNVGDWLYFTDMGAYSQASATKFNGFTDDHKVIFVYSEAGARSLLGLD
ncbi:pyridoxal-dependent decarboxylase [Kalaharituber pfeilii]|nr:pyridoxal-dependent decarboxylase [Kalaharituber pfeilii]